MSLSGGNSNNQNPQPCIVNAARYPRDPKYYFRDGSGVLLVDRVLFKASHGNLYVLALTLSNTPPSIQVHATLIFGPRPLLPYQAGPFSLMFIEDITPMLPNSNDSNPIEIPGITVSQFRDYLLVLLGRPYDTEYSSLITSYNDSSKHSKDLSIRYLDIASLSHRFGMIELESWAINALHSIFTGAATTLTRIASENWKSETVLKLRAFTKATKLNLPVLTFIQYLISVGSSDETIASLGDRTRDLPCVGLYHSFKASDTEPVLFGCAFLNILSLGHRSSVWTKCLDRNDREILYAAQAQLVNISAALELDFGWLSASNASISRQLCEKCKTRLLQQWDKGFGKCKQELGSGFPLKDVLLLAQLPIYRHKMRASGSWVSWGFAIDTRCTKNPDCSAILLGSVETHIQQVFTKATSQYKKIVEEL